VRILFTFAGGAGHAEPLIPIARAAEAAGHVVAITGRPSIVETLATGGLTAFGTGSELQGGSTIKPLLELDPDREARDLREGFGRRLARERARAILDLCRDWQPAVVVCDETDFGSVVAAERLGLVYATVLVIAAGSFVRPDVIAEPLNEVRAEHGLPADPGLESLSRYLVLAPFPPSIRDPAHPLPATAHSLQPAAMQQRRPEHVPQWVADLDARPTVYFTLGTVFNMESGDLFARVLSGLRELPVNVIATVGRQFDPDDLGPQPENVHIERYIPQSSILSRCRVVVSHGGSGSVIGALAHGLPSVLLPMGADQPLNAARCEALGVAQVLNAVRATPQDVRAAVADVLADASYSQSARRLHDEMARLPGAASAVVLLERLVAERRPLLAN
jgi:UDP:flavonoid glycosyltransferase YjiC (YdhE family)